MTDIGTMIRESFGRTDDIRDAGLTTPPDVVRYDDLVYGSDPAWQALDVYRPRSAAGETLPVIVSVHGGGWVYGDKERYQFYCMSLAQRGFAVVNFTYRLAPEFQYPAPLEDTNLVFGWILRHADQYGLDTNRLFAVGDSAGGNILGLYAAFCTNPAYAARFSFQPHPSVKLRAVGLFCGDYEIDPAQNPDALSTQIMQVYLPERGSPRELEEMSVFHWITPDYPPVFLTTAVDDFLKDHAHSLAACLIQHDVPFQFHFYGSRDTRLGHVFHLDLRSPEGRRCNDETCAFFRNYL